MKICKNCEREVIKLLKEIKEDILEDPLLEAQHFAKWNNLMFREKFMDLRLGGGV